MRPSMMAAVSCAAGLLFSDEMATAGSDYYSQPPAPDGGFAAGSNTLVVRSAENFVVTTPVTSAELHWWGGNDFGPIPPTEDFQIRFFRDRGPNPGLPTLPGALFSSIVIPWAHLSREPSGITDAAEAQIYLYKAPIIVSLPVGEQLWISICHVGSGWSWYQSSSGDDYTAYEYPGFGIPWSSAFSSNAFELAVPAPGAGFLGLGGIVLRRRR